MAYLRTYQVTYNFAAFNNQGQQMAVLQAAVHVHIDASAQHHYTAAEVNGLLDAEAQAVGVMNRDYPGGGWYTNLGQRTYRITTLHPQGANIGMLFRWAQPNALLPTAPYLYHIDAPQQTYKQELLTVTQRRFAESVVKPDPFASLTNKRLT